MSFRHHPVFADDTGDHTAGPGAVVIGLRDRVVRRPRDEQPPSLPVADVSLRRTATRLGALASAEWCVVHDPAMGPDHLVVGTAGVYAVWTTRLIGTVLVAGGVMLHNGRCADHLSLVQAKARHLSARLAVAVRPLLVVDADVLRVREEPTGVGLTSSHRVARWLERQPATLERGTVFRVTAAAQRSRTWR
jgi:hypothetical protein